MRRYLNTFLNRAKNDGRTTTDNLTLEDEQHLISKENAEGDLQQQIKSLKASNQRLRHWLVWVTVVLALGLVGLAIPASNICIENEDDGRLMSPVPSSKTPPKPGGLGQGRLSPKSRERCRQRLVYQQHKIAVVYETNTLSTRPCTLASLLPFANKMVVPLRKIKFEQADLFAGPSSSESDQAWGALMPVGPNHMS